MADWISKAVFWFVLFALMFAAAGLALEAITFFNSVVHDLIVLICGKNWPLLVLGA